jgi:signal transduction histidine kinase
MLGGMYWRGATRNGAFAGLLGGFAVWLYTLLLPSFAKSGWLPADFLQGGLFGIELLRPQQLFGVVGMDSIAHSLFWSLFANIGGYVGVSLMRRPNALEAGQATLFVDVFEHGRPTGGAFWRGSANVAELLPLIARFIGRERADRVFSVYAHSRGKASAAALEGDPGLVHFAETTLAGAIGSASARVVVASVVKEEPLGLDEVMNILDEASQVRAYSRRLEQKSRELEAATAELRRANERLTELDRMKDDFMSSVTHELRTPLTSIRAFSEMLLEDPQMAQTDRMRFLAIIVSESERLTRLVNQVLDMAKIDSGHAEWHNGEVDLAAVITQAVASTSQLFKDKGVRLDVALPAAAPRLLADRDRLIQVMLNLLSNAVKFVARDHGRVAVTLAVTPAGLQVDVGDNGPGLSAAEQAIIFEKFRQGGNTMTDKPQGTGLGLPISRQIVEHYGGRLWVVSGAGKGAVFSFLLPCDTTTEAKAAAG